MLSSRREDELIEILLLFSLPLSTTLTGVEVCSTHLFVFSHFEMTPSISAIAYSAGMGLLALRVCNLTT
jgi:hypothetical protein